MKSELLVEILRWVVDNHDLRDIIGRGHFLHVYNKISAAGQEKKHENSRKMRGREKLSKYYRRSIQNYGSACSSRFQVLILDYFWRSGRRVFGYHMITGDMIWHGFGMEDMS